VDGDLDLDGITGMEAAIVVESNGSRGLGVGQIHESSPRGGANGLMGPLCGNHRQLGTRASGIRDCGGLLMDEGWTRGRTRAGIFPELGRHSQFGIKFRGFIEDSIFYYQNGFSDVADVFRRIAVDQREVG
jgi:hypothetical protein